ncbi:hypothetical protein GN956_G23047 [Arapaima gigas]
MGVGCSGVAPVSQAVGEEDGAPTQGSEGMPRKKWKESRERALVGPQPRLDTAAPVSSPGGVSHERAARRKPRGKGAVRPFPAHPAARGGSARVDEDTSPLPPAQQRHSVAARDTLHFVRARGARLTARAPRDTVTRAVSSASYVPLLVGGDALYVLRRAVRGTGNSAHGGTRRHPPGCPAGRRRRRRHLDAEIREDPDHARLQGPSATRVSLAVRGSQEPWVRMRRSQRCPIGGARQRSGHPTPPDLGSGFQRAAGDMELRVRTGTRFTGHKE